MLSVSAPCVRTTIPWTGRPVAALAAIEIRRVTATRRRGSHATTHTPHPDPPEEARLDGDHERAQQRRPRAPVTELGAVLDAVPLRAEHQREADGAPLR